MHPVIQNVIQQAQEKFELDHYHLHTWNIYRDWSMTYQTDYTLEMVWLPDHISEPLDEDEYPDGAVSIEYSVSAQKWKSAVFINEVSYSEKITFSAPDLKKVISWIEQETGLLYQKQFVLQNAENGEYTFLSCINLVPTAHYGMIILKADKEGRLVRFSISGDFPSDEQIMEEVFTLTLKDLEALSKEQVKLVHFPVSQKTRLPVYAIEEHYVRNSHTSSSISADEKDRTKIEVHKVIEWDTPSPLPFQRKIMEIVEEVSIEQALAREPHPDAFPISEEETEKCIHAVKEALRSLYPKESGEWVLYSLHREEIHIMAHLLPSNQINTNQKRKLKLIIDPKTFQGIQYFDSEEIMNMFSFEPSEEAAISHEKAWTLLKDHLELFPRYVYDDKLDRYVLCGKLDCDLGVNAVTGELVRLEDL